MDFPVWWMFCMRPQNDGEADDTDPSDDAGVTRWGWTLPTWQDAMRYVNKPPLTATFAAMDQTAAGLLAESYFWNRLGGPIMPDGADVSIIDWCWNSGPGIIIDVQQNLHVETDGIIGPETCAAMAAYGLAALVGDICAWRIAFLDAHGFKDVAPGLYDRATACRDLALTLIVTPLR